jgi:hypothetical protein
MKKLLSILIIILLLTSCGNNSQTDESSPSIAYSNDGVTKESSADYVEGETDLYNNGIDSQETVSDTQKLIKQFSLTMETKKFDELIINLNQIIIDNDAYIQNSDEYTNSYNQARTLNMIIRIPRENSSSTRDDIAVLGTVTNRSENVRDVTDSYSNVDARLKTLYVEEQTYLDILEKAKTVDEVLQIQNYLSDTRYNIESYESQKRNYDLLISYDTLSVSVYEVEKISPVEEQTIFEEIGSNFLDSVKGIGEMLRSLVVFIVGDILYIVLFVVVIYLAVIFTKKIRKNKKLKFKKNKKVEEDKNV